MIEVKEKILRKIRERRIVNLNERMMGAIHNSQITLICTNKRVIFYKPRSLGRYDVESFPLEHVSYVQFKKGLLSSTLIVRTDSGEKMFGTTPKFGVKMQEIMSNQIMIVKAVISGETIPEPNPMMTLQMRYANGEIGDDEYLRKMTLL